jgi:hypothetical protein
MMISSEAELTGRSALKTSGPRGPRKRVARQLLQRLPSTQLRPVLDPVQEPPHNVRRGRFQWLAIDRV